MKVENITSVVKVETSWCTDDVRFHFEEKVAHMTDKEIQKELDGLANGLHEACVSSGWDVIESCFTIKETNG